MFDAQYNKMQACTYQSHERSTSPRTIMAKGDIAHDSVPRREDRVRRTQVEHSSRNCRRYLSADKEVSIFGGDYVERIYQDQD